MDGKKPGFSSIDQYIATFPDHIQTLLQSMRTTIHTTAPDAEEIISYQMPAFALKGNLVYFAALKHHIGFYPTSSGIQAFADELTRYKSTKGAVQFPIGEPLPLDLVSKIVAFRVAENLEKAAMKASKKSKKESATDDK